MFACVLQLAYFCSLCVSLPLPETRDSTYPPFLLNTVFPLCDGECNYIPGYRTTQGPDDREGRTDSTTTSSTTTSTNAPSTTTITTTTVTTTTTTTVSTTAAADPQTSTVFASCDGECPRFPVYKVALDEDESDDSESSTVFAAPVGTSTTASVGSTSTPELATETTTPAAAETNPPSAAETSTQATAATETTSTDATKTTTSGTTVTPTPEHSAPNESSTINIAATSAIKNASVKNSTTDADESSGENDTVLVGTA